MKEKYKVSIEHQGRRNVLYNRCPKRFKSCKCQQLSDFYKPYRYLNSMTCSVIDLYHFSKMC